MIHFDINAIYSLTVQRNEDQILKLSDFRIDINSQKVIRKKEQFMQLLRHAAELIQRAVNATKEINEHRSSS